MGIKVGINTIIWFFYSYVGYGHVFYAHTLAYTSTWAHKACPYMDPPRFARHRIDCDKKKVAAIYPACLHGHIAAGPDEFRSSLSNHPIGFKRACGHARFLRRRSDLSCHQSLHCPRNLLMGYRLHLLFKLKMSHTALRLFHALSRGEALSIQCVAGGQRVEKPSCYKTKIQAATR